nr:MAG TPA: hypothetical protein [Bacteriophage sp.]
MRLFQNIYYILDSLFSVGMMENLIRFFRMCYSYQTLPGRMCLKDM